MVKVYKTLIILYILHLVNGMVLFEMDYHIMDKIYKRQLKYEHHRQNYLTSLVEETIPFGLRLIKNP